MDKRAIFQAIAEDVAKGELAFPTSAQVALKIRQTLDDPDCHVDTAAKLVQAEPLLSARVVAMANSVAYNRSGTEITDVRTAISRLGFRTVRSLATALVTRQMAGDQNAAPYRDMVNQLWEHTAHVASLAHVIARRVTHVDADTAMFVGIVHEVGGFYMMSRLKDYPGLLDGDFSAWIDGGETAVGQAVVKALAVPESVFDALTDYWDGYLALPPVTLGDTLLLAEELAPIASPLHKQGGRERGEGMAASIEVSLGDETLSGILAESAEVVESLIGALRF